jgi:uncharacterized phiE125 gp8 family phage protein
MKTIVHRVQTSQIDPFTLSGIKDYLRVTHDDEDLAITQMARASAAELEHFAQIALLTQTIRVTVFDPVWAQTYLSLPIGPVQEDAVATVTIDGEAFTAFDLVTGSRPSIRWLASYFDLQPTRITIEYQAGFGSTVPDIPPDLAQAIKDQTCLQYGGRSPFEKNMLTSSPQFARVGARHRGVSI